MSKPGNNKTKGDNLEAKVREYLNLWLPADDEKFKKRRIEIGGREKKEHEFDLVNEKRRIAVECKNYSWTRSGNVPSAKRSILNEAALFMHFLGHEWKKFLVISKSTRHSAGETLAENYFKSNYPFLDDITVVEFDIESKQAEIIVMGENGVERTPFKL